MQERAEAEAAERAWRELEGDRPADPLVRRAPQIRDAEAELAAARALLQKRQLDLQRTRVVAPFAGRVQAVVADLGQTVQAGQRLATLFDTSAVEIRLPLPLEDAAFVDLPLDGTVPPEGGPEVLLRASYGDRTHEWRGRIVRIGGESRSAHAPAAPSRACRAGGGTGTGRRTPAAAGRHVRRGRDHRPHADRRAGRAAQRDARRGRGLGRDWRARRRQDAPHAARRRVDGAPRPNTTAWCCAAGSRSASPSASPRSTRRPTACRSASSTPRGNEQERVSAMHDDPTVPPDEKQGFFAWFTQNHVAATLVALTFLVAGAAALFGGRVRREVFPEIEPNIVTVQVPYPGATPTEVESGVCLRVEEAVEGITGVDKVTSSANEGVGLIVVETLQDADLEQVLSDVKNRVDAITNFPAEIEEPIVSRLVLRKEVINVSVYGDVDELVLKRTRGARARRPGRVAADLAGRTRGGPPLRDHDRTERGSAAAPRAALRRRRQRRAHRQPRPAGRGHQGRRRPDAAARRRPGLPRHRLREARAADATGRHPVTIGDVARVVDGFAEDDLAARFDGRPAVLLKVFRVGEQDAIAVTAAVRDWVAGPGTAMLPHGVQLATWRDESILLRGRIDLLLGNALQGLVLVFVILALFLELRIAMWVAVGIPVAFLGAAALMPSLGLSVNMISLFAFLLVLGIVVDDAIVVGENIVLHRRAGASSLLAALRGSREVRTPVFASVMTTVAAFLPMVFSIPGSDAQIWRVIPLIVIPVLLISLIESQLCLPAHLAMLAADRPGHRPALPARLWLAVQGAFQGGLDWLTRRLPADARDLAALALRDHRRRGGAARPRLRQRRRRLPTLRVLPDGRRRQRRRVADDAAGHADDRHRRPPAPHRAGGARRLRRVRPRSRRRARRCSSTCSPRSGPSRSRSNRPGTAASGTPSSSPARTSPS
jgi:hypothetical protein